MGSIKTLDNLGHVQDEDGLEPGVVGRRGVDGLGDVEVGGGRGHGRAPQVAI